MSGLPFTVCCNTGKSARMRSTSHVVATSRVDVPLVIDIVCRGGTPWSPVEATRTGGHGVPPLQLRLQRRVQLTKHDLVEFRPDRRDLDLPDHFFSEAVRQQTPAKLRRDAARLQV